MMWVKILNTILKLLEKQVKFHLVEPLHLIEQMTLVVRRNFFSAVFFSLLLESMLYLFGGDREAGMELDDMPM